MMAAPVMLDANAFRDAPPAAFAAAVLRATVPASVAPPVEYYADRMAALGLDVPAAVAALACVAPGARIAFAAAPRGEHIDIVSLHKAVLASCDPARLNIVQDALAAFVSPHGAGQGAGQGAAAAVPGCLAVTLADAAVAHAYFHPPAAEGWRPFVRPPRAVGACVLAARDAQLGLLLGDGMIFHGSLGVGDAETLPPGLVLSGPRVALPPAEYWLDVAISLPGNARLLLDISSNRGLRRLAQFTLRGMCRAEFGFSTDAGDDAVEIRLVNLGAAPVAGRIKQLAIRS
jgi:hypothetical protein